MSQRQYNFSTSSELSPPLQNSFFAFFYNAFLPETRPPDNDILVWKQADTPKHIWTTTKNQLLIFCTPYKITANQLTDNTRIHLRNILSHQHSTSEPLLVIPSFIFPSFPKLHVKIPRTEQDRLHKKAPLLTMFYIRIFIAIKK